MAPRASQRTGRGEALKLIHVLHRIAGYTRARLADSEANQAAWQHWCWVRSGVALTPAALEAQVTLLRDELAKLTDPNDEFVRFAETILRGVQRSHALVGPAGE